MFPQALYQHRVGTAVGDPEAGRMPTEAQLALTVQELRAAERCAMPWHGNLVKEPFMYLFWSLGRGLIHTRIMWS